MNESNRTRLRSALRVFVGGVGKQIALRMRDKEQFPAFNNPIVYTRFVGAAYSICVGALLIRWSILLLAEANTSSQKAAANEA